MKTKQKLISLGLSLLLFYVSLELSSFAVLLYLDQAKGIRYESYTFSNLSENHRLLIQKLLKGETKYLDFDFDLGWAPKKNGKRTLYQANALGFRANRDYEDFPPADKKRIAAFGDSFTHGDDVSNQKMWTAQLEERDKKLEVLNFGVPGFGFDQAYLRYQKEWKNFYPDIVLIGFMDENIRRVVNVYRPFLYPNTTMPLSKPRFRASEGELLLLRNPSRELKSYKRLLEDTEETIRRFSKNDYYAQHLMAVNRMDVLPVVRLVKLLYARSRKVFPEKIQIEGKYNSEFEGYEIVKTIFDHFYASVERNGAKPVIVLFSSKETYAHYLKSEQKVYQSFIDYFEEKGYRYFDSLEAFSQVSDNYSAENLFSKTAYPHYSEVGSKVFSEALYDYLKREELL